MESRKKRAAPEDKSLGNYKICPGSVKKYQIKVYSNKSKVHVGISWITIKRIIGAGEMV